MKRVLIVDDCDVNIILAQRFLVKMGWEVFTVTSGPECLEFLKTNTVDLVLLDISMPVMSGFEVCEIIRNTPEIKYLTVIAYTAHAMQDEIKNCMKTGFDDILIKPITRAKLEEKIINFH
jgi:CheY-like chemotaxis protein